jgi:hypothetical protein
MMMNPQIEPKLPSSSGFDAWKMTRKDAIHMPPLEKVEESNEKKRPMDVALPILPSLSSITAKLDAPHVHKESAIPKERPKLPGFDEAFLKVVALQYEQDFPKQEAQKVQTAPRPQIANALSPSKMNPAFLLPLGALVEENFDSFKNGVPSTIPSNPFGTITSFWNGSKFNFATPAPKFIEDEQTKKKFKPDHIIPTKESSQTSSLPQFEIVQHPSKYQRRSYSKENRWITPKPTISCCRDRFELGTCYHGQISGNIRVIWTDEEGNPRKDQDGLQGPSKEAAIVQNQAIFLLKSHTSAQSAFRLRFEITFTMANDPTKTILSQTILSNPFHIKTHSRSLKKAIQEEKE